MRAVDFQLEIAVKRHWQGEEVAGLCPLLANVDQLLKYLDEEDFAPGDAITRCPVCGNDHRWVLLKGLLIFALELRPHNKTKLLVQVDKSLDEIRALYGGEAGYKEMTCKADEFFAKLENLDHCYKP